MENNPISEIATKEMDLDENVDKISFKGVKDAFHVWLYIEDEFAIDVVFATILANKFSGDPIWLFLISPPGGCKSEILRALGTSNETYILSSLTENTLISGFKIKPDPSLIPKLDGKVLIIKDFTAILGIHRDARAKIIGDLRDAYDDECCKTFGTGEKKSYKSKFGLIAGVTPVIDKHWGIQADLGERFLRFRIRLSDRQKAIERAAANTGQEKKMRAQLSSISQNFLSSCGGYRVEDIAIESDLDQRIRYLANLLALGRSRVSRDYNDGTIDYEPDPEIGTRVVKQLKLLGAGFACIHDRDCLNEEDYEFIKRICRDTLPSKEAKILQTMFLLRGGEGIPVSTAEIGDETGFPTETCKKVLEDFRILKIVEREGEGTFKWRLTEKFWELCEITGLFLPF